MLRFMPSVTVNQSEGPARPIVVYDGDCSFCRSQVERMKRFDPTGRLEYLPRQTAGLEQRFPKLAHPDFNVGMRLIDSDASISVGADALYQIARRLNGVKYVAWLYRVPIMTQICRFGYARIAARRLRLAQTCQTDTCEVADVSSEVSTD
jgi:predicted DCC family thiol-disulfide oxidoreductase YuxK